MLSKYSIQKYDSYYPSEWSLLNWTRVLLVANQKKTPPISIGCLCKIWLHNCIMDIMKIISLLSKSYKSKELIQRMLKIYTCVMYLWLSWFSCACMIIDWNSGKSNFCRLLGNRFGLCNIHSKLPGERQMILTPNSLCFHCLLVFWSPKSDELAREV